MLFDGLIPFPLVLPMDGMPFKLAVLAALCIIPTLFAGAVRDVTDRKFPAKYWEWWPVKAAAIVVFIEYLVIISDRNYTLAISLFAISIVAALVCLFVGYRYGSGGDWRAAAYVAIISPWLMPAFIIFGILAAFCLAAYIVIRPDEKLPVPYRTVPFAVAIFVGYVMAIVAGLAA